MKNQEIKNLEQELIDAELNYRLGLDTNLSDEEFDRKYKRLQELYGDDIPDDSVLKNIIPDKTEDFKKVQHSSKMLSLDNTYNLDELKDWLNGLPKNKYLSLLLQYKVDGCSLSCVYENRKLVRIVTRGDGVEGEDITSNLGCIDGIPTKLDADFPDFIDIRGEVYMEFEEFNRINAELEVKGEKQYANPRNLAAGTIKLLDPKEAKKRKLKFMAHSLGDFSKTDGRIIFNSLDHYYNLLKKNGFNVVQTFICHTFNKDTSKDYNEIFTLINTIDKDRKYSKYPIDGAVVKINELNIQKELGETAKVPRWGIAYKFEAEKAKTKVKSITLQVGRTGAIIPVAELEPVWLSGSTVKRATCHNIDEMIARDIRVGDNVLIEKSGEIIPYIIGPVVEDRTPDIVPYHFNGKCPICGSPAEKIDDLKHWFCSNPKCPAILKAKMEYFVSKDCMDIENVSGAWVEAFINAGLINKFEDFYHLQKENLMMLDRMGDRLAEKILNNISASRHIEHWRLLNAIGVPGIGKVMAKTIIQYFDNDLSNMLVDFDHTKEVLSKIPNIADKTLNDILTFLKNNKDEISRLSTVVTPKIPSNRTSNKLLGKRICITGSFDLSRNEIVDMIESVGGKFVNSVSKKLDYLLVGDNPGSKLDKAQKLGINIIHDLNEIL